MTFPYKIEIGRRVGSCNNISNPNSKVCIRNIVKNVTVKMFDLTNLENTAKQVKFRKSCKCVYKINSSVCSEKQKFNKDKCRCQCLLNKKFQNDFVWNYSNCGCEYKKTAKLTVEKKCDVEIDYILNNKTVSITKQIKKFKPFVASSILFMSVAIIVTGIMIYFYVKSKNR